MANILLNLDKQKFKSVKFNKVDNFEEHFHDGKKLYGLTYIVSNKISKIPFKILISGQNTNLTDDMLYLTTFNKKMKPMVTFPLPNKVEKMTLIAVEKLCSNFNPNIIKESSLLSYISSRYISESEGPQNAPPQDDLSAAQMAKMAVDSKFGVVSAVWDSYKKFFKQEPFPATIVTIGVLIWVYAFLYKMYFVGKRFANWYKETWVEPKKEQQMNADLFYGQSGDEPAFIKFETLKDHINLILDRKAAALVICGPPGMSKTYSVRRTFYFRGLIARKHYNIEKGATLGVKGFYDMLYTNRDKILVLDDFDTPLQDPDMINMIKAVTDTGSKRMLAFSQPQTMAYDISNQEISQTPSKFEFRGQLIIITNLRKNQIDKAIQSRAPVYEADFNSKEVIDMLEEMKNYTHHNYSMEIKNEVYDYIVEQYKKYPNANISFRTYANALNARIGNPYGWKEMVNTMLT